MEAFYKLQFYKIRYPGAYITELPDSTVVPWRPLSVEEYKIYDVAFFQGIIPAHLLEEEIFHKQVLDKSIVNNIDKQLAGTITTVVRTIMLSSGSREQQEIEDKLNYSRHETNNLLGDLVNIICLAYPAYKPLELYKLPENEFLKVAALAEKKLIQAGVLQEPINLSGNVEKPKEKRKPFPIQSIPQQQPRPIEAQQPRTETIKTGEKKTDKQIEKTTAGYSSQSHTIISKDQMVPTNRVIASTNDEEIMKKHIHYQEVDKRIYKDYLDSYAQNGQVRIKTDEERIAEAKKRMEQNDLRLKEMMKKKSEIDKQEEERKQKLFESAKKRRRRR